MNKIKNQGGGKMSDSANGEETKIIALECQHCGKSSSIQEINSNKGICPHCNKLHGILKPVGEK
ncbi:hypothetical protein ACFL9U_10775 [Thermodesulfobacteriota bacterium]